MPTNLFEQRNSFRLVDVDGKFLPSPNDYIVINEVDGFGDMKIILERGKKSHGFNYEFGEEEKTYGFDGVTYVDDNGTAEAYSPFELLKGLYDIDSFDANCILEYRENDILQFSGRLDFEEYVEIDYKITIKVRRVNFDDLFRTRQKTKVNVTDSQSIDGIAITPPSSDAVFLHSKILFQESLLTGNGLLLDFDNESTFSEIPIFKLEFDEVEFSGGDKAYIQSNASEEPPEGILIGGSFALNVPRAVAYKARFRFEYDVTLTGIGGSAATTELKLGRATKDFSESEADVFINEEVTVQATGTGTVNASGSFEWEINKFSTDQEGTNVYIWVDYCINNGANCDLDLDDAILNSSSFSLELDNVEENSFAEMYNSFDVVNHCVEAITNVVNPLESTLLDTDAINLYLANGYLIRAFEEISSNADTVFKYSFKDLFEGWIQPFFGAGWQVYQDSGDTKIAIERYEFFYQDNEIDFIESVIDESFELSVDESSIFNEIKVGYKEFPKATDENKENNIDEFNTVHEYLTPVKRVEKEFEAIVDFIASGFKIENQRREAFQSNSTRTVTDDVKTFFLKAITINSYDTPDNVTTTTQPQFLGTFLGEDFNRIRIPGTWYDIRVGDTITISNFDPSVNGNYTVDDVQIVGNTTRIKIPLSPVTLLTKAGSITVGINRNSLVAERDDQLDSLDNVFSPETVYNIGMHPKNILLNHSQMIKSGLTKKTSAINKKSIELNEDMFYTSNSGSFEYIINNGNKLLPTIIMKNNVGLSRLEDPIFSGEKAKWKSRIGYDRVKNIRDKCLNQHPTDNLGYVRVSDSRGVEYKVYLDQMKYNPLSEEVEFKGRVKYDP